LDGRIDWVRDDEDIGFWCDIRDDFDEALDDASVDVEEIITGHSWLAGNSSGDDNNVCILHGKLGSIILWEIAGDFSG